MTVYVAEEFDDSEADVLRRYFTNLDQPVFALVNLPEVVKGALFARYSRSSKSLRRLFLDEFVGDLDIEGDQTIDATVGLITGAHLATMKAGATFINTARGAIVREAEMIDVLQARPDLLAVLDVTYPEPPVGGSPLYSLPNVILTPHIAGSLDTECQRMGQIVVDELQRYLAGEPLQWAISQEQASIMA